MEPIAAFAILLLIIAVCAGSSTSSRKDKKYKQSEIFIGKDEDGYCVFVIRDNGTTKILFRGEYNECVRYLSEHIEI